MMIRPLPAEVKSHLRSGVAITTVTQCVEELLLNSLDAGATCIAIRVDLSHFYIQVVDNGTGVSRDQLDLLATRYATSKCHSVSDLENLCYFGFRGEALASIRDSCAIMQFVTREKNSSSTYCRIFQSGKPLAVSESTAPRPCAGTTITIHNLFENFPVRQKSTNENLELEKIKQRVEGLALLKTGVSVSLRNDTTGNVIVQTHKSANTLSTFAHLFGHSKANSLVEVSTSKCHFTVEGYLGKEANTKKSLQFIYINGRLVLKTKLHKIVTKSMMKSVVFRKKIAQSPDVSAKSALSSSPTKFAEKYPVYVLNVKCPLTEYDITFDPSKTLVEFKDWETLLQCTSDMVDDFLKKEKLDVNVELKSASTFKLPPSLKQTESGNNPNSNITSAISPSNMKDTLCSKIAKKAKSENHFTTPPQVIAAEEWREMNIKDTPLGAAGISDESLCASNNVVGETPDERNNSEIIEPALLTSTPVHGTDECSGVVMMPQNSLQHPTSDKSLPSVTSSLSRYKLYVCDNNSKSDNSKLSEVDPYKTPVSIPLKEWKAKNNKGRDSQHHGHHHTSNHHTSHHHTSHHQSGSKHGQSLEYGKKISDCKKVVSAIPLGKVSVGKCDNDSSNKIGSSLSYYRKCIGHDQPSGAAGRNARPSIENSVLGSLKRFRSQFGLAVSASRKAAETETPAGEAQSASSSGDMNRTKQTTAQEVTSQKHDASNANRKDDQHTFFSTNLTELQVPLSVSKTDQNVNGENVIASSLMNPRKRQSDDPIVQNDTGSKLSRLVQQNVAAVSVRPIETVAEMRNLQSAVIEAKHQSPENYVKLNHASIDKDQTKLICEQQLDMIDRDIDALSDYVLDVSPVPWTVMDSTSSTNVVHGEEIQLTGYCQSYLNEGGDKDVIDRFKCSLENLQSNKSVKCQQKAEHNMTYSSKGLNLSASDYDSNGNILPPTILPKLFEHRPVIDDDEPGSVDANEIPVSQGFTPMLVGSQSGLSDRVEAVSLSQALATPTGHGPGEVISMDVCHVSQSQESGGFSPAAMTLEPATCSPCSSISVLSPPVTERVTETTGRLGDTYVGVSTCNQYPGQGSEVCLDREMSYVADTDPSSSCQIQDEYHEDINVTHASSNESSDNSAPNQVQAEAMEVRLSDDTPTTGVEDIKSEVQIYSDVGRNVTLGSEAVPTTNDRCLDSIVTQESVTISQMLMTPQSVKTPVRMTVPVPDKESLFDGIFSQPLSNFNAKNVKVATTDASTADEEVLQCMSSHDLSAKAGSVHEHFEQSDGYKSSHNAAVSNDAFSQVTMFSTGNGNTFDVSSDMNCEDKIGVDLSMYNDISLGSSFNESVTETHNSETLSDTDAYLRKTRNTECISNTADMDRGARVVTLKSEAVADEDARICIKSTDTANGQRAIGTDDKRQTEITGDIAVNSRNPWIQTTDPSTGEDIFVHSDAGMVLTVDEYTRRYPQTENLSNAEDSDDKGMDTIITRSTKVLKDHLKFDHLPVRVRVDCRDGPGVTLGVDASGDGEEEREEVDDEELIKWRDRDQCLTAGCDVDSIFEAFHAEKGITSTDTRDATSCLGVRALTSVQSCKFTKQMLETVRVIGQLDNKFITCLIDTGNTCSGNDMLAVVDQHAAHERVRLEMLTEEAYIDYNIEEGILKQHELDTPKQFTFTEEEVRLMKSYTAEFARIGIKFNLDTGDRRQVCLYTVPACLVVSEMSEPKRKKEKIYWDTIQTLIKEHIEVLMTTRGAGTRLPAVIHKVLCSLACHGAIKFGDSLTKCECEALIRDLSRCDLPFQCAHGRPAIMPVLQLQQLQSNIPQQVKSKPKLYKLKSRVTK